MCGAFSILHPFRDVSGRFNADYNGPPLPPRYNARPSQRLPVILEPWHEKEWPAPGRSADAALALLKPLPANLMKCYPVSSLVDSPANDTIDVVKPARI